ncbi:MAG: type II toxin-antitoxin system RelE/ParE family toxin [Bacteroidales bacterium]|nr:type II toxin-antitoxin system RelE/ParE family toxin [Bacteroidales bacterium]
MVKYKVEWSIEARLDLLDILDYYYQRNGNANYSRKLNSKISKSINLVTKNPSLGLQTDIDSVRALVNGDYQIIYEIIETTILIVMVWDCRRNPEDKIITSRTRK